MDNPTPDQQNELEQLAKEIFIHTQTHSAERSYQRAKEFLDERNKRRKTTETTEIDLDQCQYLDLNGTIIILDERFSGAQRPPLQSGQPHTSTIRNHHNRTHLAALHCRATKTRTRNTIKARRLKTDKQAQ